MGVAQVAVQAPFVPANLRPEPQRVVDLVGVFRRDVLADRRDGTVVALPIDRGDPRPLVRRLGIALRLGPGPGAAGSVGELATTSTLKLVVQPLVAYAVAHLALGVDGPALLAVVVTSALPTAQNIFVHATRYDRATVLARDTILITTVGAVPVILLIATLLG